MSPPGSLRPEQISGSAAARVPGGTAGAHLLLRLLRVCGAGLGAGYLVTVLAWLACRQVVGDRYWWSFVLNALAFYLFAPLPVLLVLAVLVRSRALRLSVLGSTLLFVAFYGVLFVPPQLKARVPADTPRLRVMTFNVLASNGRPQGVAQSVLRSRADVVGLQEVNPAVERALRRRMARRYPYILLGPGTFSRTALLSRYPLRPVPNPFHAAWTDAPLVATLTYAGKEVRVLCLHPISTLFTATAMEREAAQRLISAQQILAYARTHPGPLVVLSDFNVSDQSTPYHVVTAYLGDAWRAAGWGLGGTFPGALSPGSSRPVMLGHPAPMWLLRIDYVFYSPALATVEAHIGPWDGVSDHRPVVATLTFNQDGQQAR